MRFVHSLALLASIATGCGETVTGTWESDVSFSPKWTATFGGDGCFNLDVLRLDSRVVPIPTDRYRGTYSLDGDALVAEYANADQRERQSWTFAIDGDKLALGAWRPTGAMEQRYVGKWKQTSTVESYDASKWKEVSHDRGELEIRADGTMTLSTDSSDRGTKTLQGRWTVAFGKNLLLYTGVNERGEPIVVRWLSDFGEGLGDLFELKRRSSLSCE